MTVFCTWTLWTENVAMCSRMVCANKVKLLEEKPVEFMKIQYLGAVNYRLMCSGSYS